MSKIPTFEEFANKRAEELGFVNWTNVIVQQEWEVIEKLPIEFAKLHVEEALKDASENFTLKLKDDVDELCMFDDWLEVDKQSIINAYPLDNIK